MSPLDRRAFLKAAGAGVGTLALAGNRALAAERQPAPAAARNSEIVVIGAGAFGGWTALYLSEMGFSVTLVDQYGPGNSRATSGTGVLKAREGCVAVAQAFEKKGGRFVTAKAGLGRRSGGTLADVTLSTGETLSAQTFVFACGPWLPKVFPAVMRNKLQTPRRVVFFYGTPPGDERFTYPNFPAWSVDNAYGFPSIEGKGFKVVPTIDHVLVDPDTQEHTLTAEELRKGRDFVAK